MYCMQLSGLVFVYRYIGIDKCMPFIIRQGGGSLGTVSTLYVPTMDLHWLIWSHTITSTTCQMVRTTEMGKTTILAGIVGR